MAKSASASEFPPNEIQRPRSWPDTTRARQWYRPKGRVAHTATCRWPATPGADLTRALPLNGVPTVLTSVSSATRPCVASA
jgi:hypothetical protein